MKIKLIGEPRVIMSNPDSRHDYFGWPSVARLKNGRIAIAASGFRLGHVCPFGKAVMAISENEGETYTCPQVVIDTVLDDRDAGLCTFGDSGLILTSFNNTRAMQRGWNETWCTPEEMKYNRAYLDVISDEEEKKYLGSTFKVSYDNGVTFGPVHPVKVTSPHGPIQLKNGNILWVGRSDEVFGNDYERIEAHLVDVEKGTTERIGYIEDIYDENGKLLLSCEPYAFELEDGRILCHIRVEPIFTTYQSISSDGGRTWSKPEPILGVRGGGPCHIMRHSSGALISAYGYREKPYGIRVMVSYDEGKTWDKDHQIYTNEFSGDLGYPATVELKDGSLLTVFYARTAEDHCEILQQRWTIEK